MKKIIYLFVLISGIAYGQNPVVIAHRGGASMAPENTLAAFKTADSIHADYYELDVQISLDDSLMIMHDASVDRTTDGTGNIAALTYAQLRLLDAGSWFGTKFTGEKIPTFREALMVAKNSTGNIGIVVELKSGQSTLAAKAVAVIQNMGLQNRVIVSSFNQSQIAQVKTIDPTIAVQRFETVTNAIIDQVAAINGEWVGSGGNFTQAIIDYAHSKGIKFNAWTINSASQMLPLIALGVDGITTDSPLVMMSLLDASAPTDVVLTSATAVESDITLTWEPAEDPESGIAGYEIYRDLTSPATTLLTTTGNVTQFIDKTFTEGQLYYYRIKAKNMAGLSSVNYSNEISVPTQSDITAPIIKYITSKDENNTVIIEFSERVNKTTAETIGNYFITDDVVVQNAKLALDQKSVILTTSPMSELSYLLTIKDVQDKAITPNTMLEVTTLFQHKSITTNVVALYTLDTLIIQDPDILVADVTANLNHGKVKNGAFITEGLLGNAIGFDGVDDFVQFETSPSFDFNTNGVTLSLWTKMDFLPTDLPSAYGPLFDSETDQYVLYEDRSNNELRFKVSTSNGAERPGIPNNMLTAGEWVHIAGIYNGTNAMIYLNGAKIDSHPLAGTVNKGQVATLGKSGTSYFKGSMDQVEVYSRALSDDEILEKYNAKTPVVIYTSIVASPALDGNFTIYPNPNNGNFTLNLHALPAQNERFDVLNSLGQIVCSGKTANKKQLNIDLGSARSGIYSVKVYTSSGVCTHRMVIK